MIGTYLRLRIERKRSAWQSSATWRVFAVLKYLLLVRLLFVAVDLASGPHPMVERVLRPLMDRDALAPAITLLAALFAHFDLALVEPIPAAPFRRLWGRRAWEGRRLAYPLCSSALLVATALLGALFHALGLAYALLLYLVFVIAERHPVSRLPLLGLSIGAGALAIPERWFVPAVIAMLAGFARLAEGQPAALLRESTGARATLSAAWQKEFAFLHAFRSDRVYFAIGAVVSTMTVLVLVRGEAVAEQVRPVFWLVPWLVLLPFTRILFNLLGSDVSALTRFRQAPRRTAAYLLWRIRIYRTPIYLLQAAAATIVWPRLATTNAHIAYGVGVVAFTEISLFCAGAYSAWFVSAKDPKYRYTGQLVETNVRLTLVLYAIIAFIVSASSSYGGLAALLILGTSICITSIVFGKATLASVFGRGALNDSSNAKLAVP
ncbi:MAG: hypothetical protein ABJE47_12830 [bacterium]